MLRYFLMLGFFLSFFISLDAVALSCMARPLSAYFECGEKKCSLLFAVKKELRSGLCERKASGFFRNHEGFEKISAAFLESGKFTTNSIFEVDLSHACLFHFISDAEGDWSMKNRKHFEDDDFQQFLDTNLSTCIRASAAKKITSKTAEEAKSRWTQEIKANHFNEAAKFVYLFIGLETVFWIVRWLLPSRLFGLSILYLGAPVVHMAFAPAGSEQFNLIYLIWPIFWLRTTAEGLQQDRQWRIYAHVSCICVCLLILCYLVFQAYISSGIL